MALRHGAARALVVAVMLATAILAGSGCASPAAEETRAVGTGSAAPAPPLAAHEPATVGGSEMKASVPSAAPPGARTRVVLLGTGTPNTVPARSGPCSAVIVDDVPYLVDMGPGLVRRAAAAYRNGVTALVDENLSRVFVTHLHTDHTVGFPDLVYTPWVMGRRVPLEVYGPPGTARMAEHVAEAWSEDVRIRLDGLEPTPDGGNHVNAHEVMPGLVYSDERVKVKAFAVPHGSWKHSYGYRFEGPDRTIVISGDTGPTDAVAKACDGCDVLVHEVYSKAAFDKLPPEWQRYHASFHTSSVELAAIAARARPKLLVLHHQLFWGVSEVELLAEVRAHYDGAVVSGSDLDVY